MCLHVCSEIVSKNYSYNMGCVNSKSDINDLQPNVFQVMNVDDLGNLINPGKLEVTELDIILYQRGNQSVKWPLKCLRRYGYDAEIFSFESGRRCSTGPGIYAFNCKRAAQLFNLVQTNIQACNNRVDDAVTRELPGGVNFVPTSRATIPVDSNYLEPTPIKNNDLVISRFSNISSYSGQHKSHGTLKTPSPPLTLPSTLPPPPPIPKNISSSSTSLNDQIHQSVTNEILENNNNKNAKRKSDVGSETLENISGQTSVAESTSEQTTPSYINVVLSNEASPLSPMYSPSETVPYNFNQEHAYMNLSPTKDLVEITPCIKPKPSILQMPKNHLTKQEENLKHSYANLEASDIETLKKRFSATSFVNDKSPIQNLTENSNAENLKEDLNYAVLDLDKKNESSDNIVISESVNNYQQTSSPPESPNKLPQQIGYATIDFNKTTALSQSVNSNIVGDIDEGSRKTRHNSTIGDLLDPAPALRNSSVSE